MKRIIIIILCLATLLLIFSSCSTTKNNDEISSDKEASASYLPTSFKNETELKNQIRANKQKGIEDRDNIDKIEFYFRLKHVPEEFYLQEIWVKPVYVMFYYTLDDKEDTNWERKIVFSWKRTLTGKENIEDMLRRINSDYKIIEEGSRKYVVTEVTRSDRDENGEEIQGTSKVVSKMIYWTQDGYAFDTVFPAWYSEKEMLEILQVEKVIVE